MDGMEDVVEKKRKEREGIFACGRNMWLLAISSGASKALPRRRTWVGAAGQIIGAARTNLDYWGTSGRHFCPENPIETLDALLTPRLKML